MENKKLDLQSKMPVKMWGVFKKDKCVSLRPLTPQDVRSHFRGVGSIARRCGRKRGEWCDRCGTLIGGTNVYQEKVYDRVEHRVKYIESEYEPQQKVPIQHRGFFLCSFCYNNKIKKHSIEATPDIEDIERMGINIDKLLGSLMFAYAKQDQADKKKELKKFRAQQRLF